VAFGSGRPSVCRNIEALIKKGCHTASCRYGYGRIYLESLAVEMTADGTFPHESILPSLNAFSSQVISLVQERSK